MPTSNDTAEKTDSPEDEEASEEKYMRKWAQWIWDNCIKNKASAWQAICAVVLTIFNILLYKVSDRATETSRASERAFLNFSHPGLGVKLIAPDKTWTGQEVSLNWVNSGNTPAKG